jgi:hypothetical protein
VQPDVQHIAAQSHGGRHLLRAREGRPAARVGQALLRARRRGGRRPAAEPCLPLVPRPSLPGALPRQAAAPRCAAALALPGCQRVSAIPRPAGAVARPLQLEHGRAVLVARGRKRRAQQTAPAADVFLYILFLYILSVS